MDAQPAEAAQLSAESQSAVAKTGESADNSPETRAKKADAEAVDASSGFPPLDNVDEATTAPPPASSTAFLTDPAAGAPFEQAAAQELPTTQHDTAPRRNADHLDPNVGEQPSAYNDDSNPAGTATPGRDNWGYGGIQTGVGQPQGMEPFQGNSIGSGSPDGSPSPFRPSNASSPVTHNESIAKLAGPRHCTAANPFWVHSAAAPQRDGATWSGGLSGGPLRCLGDVVDAVDRDYELEVPEAELSTVHIETWEQRLDWRSFLSEAVASSRARQLFKAFDVEAEPPQYVRPPPSKPVSAGELAHVYQQSGRQPPHCVAPVGAGWFNGIGSGREAVIMYEARGGGTACSVSAAALPAAAMPPGCSARGWSRLADDSCGDVDVPASDGAGGI